MRSYGCFLHENRGFWTFFFNKKFNVLSIIFYVKICANSKKNNSIDQMYIFLAFMAQKRISKRNYEK